MKTNNKKYVPLILTTLVIGVLLGWMMFGGSAKEADGVHVHTEEEQTIWTCSMHPQIRKNEPGDCPICGMDLIQLENSNEEIDPMAVRMSPTAMKLAGVESLIVVTGNGEKSIRLNGKVQADERNLYTQSSHIAGRIEKLNVNFTGEFVNKGQVIASIYSPELVSAQQELFEAQKMKDSQPQLFVAAKQKLKNWKLSENQIDEILKSQKAFDEFPILANVSGYVTKKMVSLGDYVKLGQPIYEIADLSSVWVLFDVYESDINWVKKGDKITYTIPSLPGQEFEGKITFVDPNVNPNTRVVQARVEVQNKGLKLKPEMFVSGAIQSQTSGNSETIVVPKTAVMWTGTRSVVYVKVVNSQSVSFKMRQVILGPALGDSYIIESGLETGEEIAVNGTFSIDAAAQLAGKPSMMNPDGGKPMTGHNHGGTAEVSEENEQAIESKSAISESAKNELKPLLENYFKMEQALAADDFQTAKKAGMAFNKTLQSIDMSLFKGDAHLSWMEYSKALKQNAALIPTQTTIDGLREVFIEISSGIIGVAETFIPIKDTMFVQTCPMANDNKGADWLSLNSEILNPYFGSSMLSCGETKRTIK